MSMRAICQRCGHETNRWNVHPAEFNVGAVRHWKMMLCEGCTSSVSQAIIAALKAESLESLVE
jgi:hypothetical protein